MSPDLVAFAPKAYPFILMRTKIWVPAPAPQPIDEHHGSASFNQDAQAVFSHLESRLRNCVEKRLLTLTPKWIKQRVPDRIRSKWTEMQSAARDAGGPVYDLIQYADFGHLEDVICRSDNWNDTFNQVFEHKAGLQESFRRLHPIRLAFGHNRPFVNEEILTLSAEASRILKCMWIAGH